LRLLDISPELERVLNVGALPKAQFRVSDIKCVTAWVTMRDGVKLATEVYLPPVSRAPVVATRTPYDRSRDDRGFVSALMAIARRGYAVVSQDCRGTGESEPDSWDYYIYESEDSQDCVDWITRQEWFGDFIGSFGASYVGQTQWCMATHPAMSTIAPQVSGLGVARNTARLYMFLNAYAHAVGKGREKIAIPTNEMERYFEKETMAGGYFSEPLQKPLPPAVLNRFPDLDRMAPSKARRWLWEQYCAMTCAQRAEFLKQTLAIEQVTSVDAEGLPSLFGHTFTPDALTVPSFSPSQLAHLIQAPALLITGWYDWALNDAFATWALLRREGGGKAAAGTRMIVGPYAHSMSGYREGLQGHLELLRIPNAMEYVGLLLHWYRTVQESRAEGWPAVIYYLMGANEWRVAQDWPVPEAHQVRLYLRCNGGLSTQAPQEPAPPEQYVYDPTQPTPTVGGSVVSYIYPPGSVDVRGVQDRADVLVYSTSALQGDLDVVGPLKMILYVSSSATDTDFVVRLSDVFPDGRAIQLQSGILRTRYRNPESEPELLEPGRNYCLEIDLWATANRFKAGHRVRVDISSADFPHFDRNNNRGGEGLPVSAHQKIYQDPARASHLLLSVLGQFPAEPLNFGK
jgi:predicted acyl esterase